MILKRCFAIYTFFLVVSGTAVWAESLPVDEVMVHGPRHNRINLLVISEGYTAAELEQFDGHVQAIIDGFFKISPFSDYKSYFNVYTLRVASTESGTDHPNNASDESGGQPAFSAQTYFNSSFDVAGIHRLLVAEERSVNRALMDSFPDWDAALVLVNHTWYGGSGGGVAAISRHQAALDLALHELGHSFSGLFDEYGGNGSISVGEGPNVTAINNRDQIKWKAWIDPSTPIPTPATPAYADVIGLFEGANYHNTGWYRPKLRCMMRALGDDFCAVCKEHVIQTIYRFISPIDSYEPISEAVILASTATVEFAIEHLLPMENTLTIEWFIDDVPVPGGEKNLLVDGAALEVGDHRIEVRVSDGTDKVRTDPENLLKTQRVWQLKVVPPPPSYERWVPHVTSATGGFRTQIYLRSMEMETTAEVILVPFDSLGQPLTVRTVALNPRELRILNSSELFQGEMVSHFAVETAMKVSVSVGYRSALGNGGTAHVPESVTSGKSFAFYPGEWEWVFDGMALIHLGDEPADVWVHQMLQGDTPHASHRYSPEDGLAALEKLLVVFSADFEEIEGAYFRVESSQPVHFVLLRGNEVGSQASYLYQTVAEVEP